MMYVSMISGYELGQFLRILLWIAVPAVILLTMITTWLQYRRRRSQPAHLLLAIEGGPAGEEMEKELIASSFDGQTVDDRVEELAPQTEDEYKENLYKGILWMKEKYEQYRDLSDERYSRLKDQLTLVEKRYEDLLEAASNGQPIAAMQEQRIPAADGQVRPAVGAVTEEVADPGSIIEEEGITAAAAHAPVEGIPLEREERSHAQELEEKFARTRQRLEEELSRLRYQLEEQVSRSRRQLEEQAADSSRQLEQQAIHSSRALEEKQRIIADLESQTRSDRQKIEELVTKLKNNSQLLMNIYQELDKSIHLTDVSGQP
jgi:hypothetical protein